LKDILDFGIRFIMALQGWGSWLAFPMQLLSLLGTQEFFILLLPILYWCVDSLLGIRVAIMLLLSTSFNGALKMAFHGPRPYWYSPDVHGLAAETSFGIPSNHAQNATVVWGILAAALRKWWAWLAAILLIGLIGFSRLYLGVHFPQDVVLGWLIGGLILWLTLRFWDPVAAWIKKHRATWQVLAAFWVSLAIFLLSCIPFIWLKAIHWQPPSDWAAYATQAITLQGAATSAGTLFGLLGGLVWIECQGGFQTKGPWWKLVLRFLLGIAGVLIMQYGLKLIFPWEEDILGYFLRYLQNALIGFWVTGAAPWTFIRLKLAEKSQQGGHLA
jgi:membrane-associated phospholipid phosphatase